MSTLLRILFLLSALFLSGCCEIFTNLFPACWPLPGYTVAPCLDKCAFTKFAGPIELPHHIALLVPLHGPNASAGRAIKAGFKDAYANQGFLCRPEVIEVIDTSCFQCVQQAIRQAICHDADFIVGPLLQWEVASMASEQIKINTLSLNYLDPEEIPPVNLYQFGLSPLEEIHQITSLAKCEGHCNSLIITPCGPWGNGITERFCARWFALGGKVAGEIQYNDDDQLLAAQICQTLQSVKCFDSIFLVGKAEDAAFIRKILRANHCDVPIYATSLINSDSPCKCPDCTLDGITFVDIPYMLCRHGRRTYDPRFYALGHDAFLLSVGLNGLTLKMTINGATGTLALNKHNRIVRVPVFARFCNGVPRLIQ